PPAHQGEVDGQDVSPLPAREVRGRFDHLVDVRVGEQRYVESRGLLRLAVVPEARDYAFHGGLDLAWRSLRFLRHVGSSFVSSRAANRPSPIEFVFESIESASVSSETISRHCGVEGPCRSSVRDCRGSLLPQPLTRCRSRKAQVGSSIPPASPTTSERANMSKLLNNHCVILSRRVKP